MSNGKEEVEILPVEMQQGSGTLTELNKVEIDIQIHTAKSYPRSLSRFQTEAKSMVTLTEQIAESCIYALPRAGKTIEGPSIRFAELITYAWGNCRAGTRVVAEEKDFVVAQGVFHDLEKNVFVACEIKRRIVNKHGKRFDVDMIGVTANAAASIALRNAMLRVIPRALWESIYQAARATAIGSTQTLVNKRAKAIEYLQKFGVTQEMICYKLGVPGIEDIGLDHILVLSTAATAIKEGQTTVESAFPSPADEATEKAHGKQEELTQKLKKIKDPNMVLNVVKREIPCFDCKKLFDDPAKLSTYSDGTTICYECAGKRADKAIAESKNK